jgi:hypothetical protein
LDALELIGKVVDLRPRVVLVLDALFLLSKHAIYELQAFALWVNVRADATGEEGEFPLLHNAGCVLANSTRHCFGHQLQYSERIFWTLDIRPARADFHEGRKVSLFSTASYLRICAGQHVPPLHVCALAPVELKADVFLIAPSQPAVGTSATVSLLAFARPSAPPTP